MANSVIFQTKIQLKKTLSNPLKGRENRLPISRDGVQMMSIRTEFQIRDNLSVTTEGGHALRADRVPEIDAFVRTGRRQVSSRGVDIDFNQISRIVVHRTFASSNSFAILGIVDSNHSVLTGRVDQLSAMINGEIIEGLFLHDVVRTNELILSIFILKDRRETVVREREKHSSGITLEIERKINDLSALQEIN